MKWAGRSDTCESLPPRSRCGSAASPKLNQGLGLPRVVSKDVAAALLVGRSDGTASVGRSLPSGSKKDSLAAGWSVANDFQWTLHSRDLPESVRPIIEDNKMLHGELRRYRQRLVEQEGQLSTKERQVLALRDELERCQKWLQRCSVAPAQLMQEQQYRKMLLDRDVTIQHSEHKAAVMQHAKQVAERRLNNDLAADRRQQAELKKQLKQLQDELAERQKQVRFNQSHINQLYRRLEPLEAAMAAVTAAPPPSPPHPCLEEAAPREPEERVQLMLCMVHAQPQPTAAEIAEAAARLAGGEFESQLAALWRQRGDAACRIQAAVRGFNARRQLAAQQQAANRVQAAFRGMQARRAVAPLLAQQRAIAAAANSQARGEQSPSRLRLAVGRQQRGRQAVAARGGRPSCLAGATPPLQAGYRPSTQRQRQALIRGVANPLSCQYSATPAMTSSRRPSPFAAAQAHAFLAGTLRSTQAAGPTAPLHCSKAMARVPAPPSPPLQPPTVQGTEC